MHDDPSPALLRRWTTLWGRSDHDVVAAGEDLLRRYAEPHRRYHDTHHLADVLHSLDRLAGHTPPPEPVVLAAYFHDAVYDPRADDNEERSADLAARALPRLCAPRAVTATVTRLVRLTATHHPDPDDPEGGMLCDADLAVLGSEPERYRAYAAAIREEYAHVDDPGFRKGRTDVLRRLRGMQLFSTREGRRRWQQPAERNIATELKELESLSAPGADATPPPSAA